MKDILTCQNHPDVVISHAETLMLLPVGKGLESGARILTEASKLDAGDQGAHKGACPDCTLLRKHKNIQTVCASGQKGPR